MADTLTTNINDITNVTVSTATELSVVSESGYTPIDYREAYVEQLLTSDKESEAYNTKISYIDNNDETTPISTYNEVHGDKEPNRDEINLMVLDSVPDFMIIDNAAKNLASAYSSLIYNTHKSFDNYESIIKGEYERIKDLNLLCSAYDNLDNIIQLTSSYFSGSFNYDSSNNTFSAYSTIVQEPVYIVDIQGNGYEGNTFAYDIEKKAFVDDLYGEISRAALNDGNLLTSYEYSRICAQSADTQNKNINVDNINAKCSIYVQTVQNIDSIKINGNSKTQITDVLTSNDNGGTYTSTISDTLPGINTMLGLPNAKYIKLDFESDNIDTKYAVAADSIVNGEKGIKVYDDAQRKVISLSQIFAYRNTYDNDGLTTIKTDNLVSSDKPLKAIGIYADVYVPDCYPKTSGTDNSYVIFTLTINGKAYQVLPLNSNDKGIKLISYRDNTYANSFISYLSETIKTATLTVQIQALDGYGSPQVSNLKLCTGE